MSSFDEQYRDLLAALLREGVREVNQRTGHATLALPGMTLEVPTWAASFRQHMAIAGGATSGAISLPI